MPVNGGTAEAANIIASQTQTASKIDDVRALLEIQFRKSIAEGDIISVVDDVDDVFRTASQGAQATSRVAVNPSLMEKLALVRGFPKTTVLRQFLLEKCAKAWNPSRTSPKLSRRSLPL